MTKSVMLIEDDAAIRKTIAALLELEGYRVFTASNGRDAIKHLTQIEKPRLILLDILMPVMNGWEFLDEKKRNTKLAPVPVVIISAFRATAETLKANEVLEKPIQYDTLLEVVEKYCA